jgi:acetyl-CoA C-acetyltransferase
MKEAFIFEALRTPRGKGKPDGALHQVRSVELLALVLQDLQKRLDLDTSQVDDGIFGCVTPIDDQGGNIAKTALLFANWHHRVGGVQINRYCCSGLDAVNLATMKILSGLEDLVVAGGIESMSRVPMSSDGGPILFDPDVVSRINYVPQGVAADLIASSEGFSRETLDAFALQSHQRAARAQANGYFKSAIVPIYDSVGLLILEEDEHIRPHTSLEALAALKPSFAEIGATGFDDMALLKYPWVERVEHVHTAGNSSGIVDGAAAVLVGSKEKGAELGLKPRAKILAIATVSCDPTMMLLGHISAARKALKIAGMKSVDIDLWEVNEAFAAVALKFERDLNISDSVMNVNGGAIALGHPLGATGAMLVGSLLCELERANLSTGLIALCAGGGMGVAMIIQRV